MSEQKTFEQERDEASKIGDENHAIWVVAEFGFRLGADWGKAYFSEEIERLKKELNKQLHVNGKGAERELKLMAEIERLKNENPIVRETDESLSQLTQESEK
jgi:uncharacterized small protein (DUF1192 family)